LLGGGKEGEKKGRSRGGAVANFTNLDITVYSISERKKKIEGKHPDNASLTTLKGEEGKKGRKG